MYQNGASYVPNGVRLFQAGLKLLNQLERSGPLVYDPGGGPQWGVKPFKHSYRLRPLSPLPGRLYRLIAGQTQCAHAARFVAAGGRFDWWHV